MKLTEVVFPLLQLDGYPSSYVDSVVAHCQGSGIQVEICSVTYHFQKGGHQMLVLRRPQQP